MFFISAGLFLIISPGCRSLLKSVDTEDSGLPVLILPDFSLSELETMLDLVYRREARQADRRTVSRLEECLRLRDIDKENVCLFFSFRTSDLTPYMTQLRLSILFLPLSEIRVTNLW